MKKIKVSIGICAFNEEENIGLLLESLLKQECKLVTPTEIIVVSSGSSDKTNEIVNSFSSKYPLIKLVTQKERKGKASAVNLFIKKARELILVLESADTIPQKNTVEKLCLPFLNSRIGMTSGRPLPVNSDDNFIGFTSNLQWRLYHDISITHPKVGEIIAFRKNAVKKICCTTAVDEAFIESIIAKKGMKIKYVPDAIVWNKGPGTVTDFIKQRRRICTGYLHLRKEFNYSSPASSSLLAFKALLKNIEFSPKKIFWMTLAVGIEGVSRALGALDYFVFRKNPYKWPVAATTKKVVMKRRESTHA